MCRHRQRLEGCAYKSMGMAATSRSWKRDMGQIVALGLQKGPILLTPWFWTSGLQSWKGLYSCCFKPQPAIFCYGSPVTLTPMHGGSGRVWTQALGKVVC